MENVPSGKFPFNEIERALATKERVKTLEFARCDFKEHAKPLLTMLLNCTGLKKLVLDATALGAKSTGTVQCLFQLFQLEHLDLRHNTLLTPACWSSIFGF